jgi:hypothetical protein
VEQIALLIIGNWPCKLLSIYLMRNRIVSGIGWPVFRHPCQIHAEVASFAHYATK